MGWYRVDVGFTYLEARKAPRPTRHTQRIQIRHRQQTHKRPGRLDGPKSGQFEWEKRFFSVKKTFVGSTVEGVQSFVFAQSEYPVE